MCLLSVIFLRVIVLKKLNLRSSEILNCITYGGKRLESNCSDVSENEIKKNDNSYNNLQKLRLNNPLGIIVRQLNINAMKNKIFALCSIFKQRNRCTFGF